LSFKEIPVFQYSCSLKEELDSGKISREELINLLGQMLAARSVEEMIAAIKMNAYQPLPGFDYFGPTHLSIGQEATSVGAVAALEPRDYITSSHRGHSDAVAKGCSYIKKLDDEQLHTSQTGWYGFPLLARNLMRKIPVRSWRKKLYAYISTALLPSFSGRRMATAAASAEVCILPISAPDI
jgi:2-oxoisovalerate dehydrogenase E1 component